MSWGALPLWIYELDYEDNLMRMSCAFEAELSSGTHKITPKHVIKMSKATFTSHEKGGWNYDGCQDDITQHKSE